MATHEVQGSKVQIGDGDDPEVFTSIGNVTSIEGPDGQAATIDITNMDSLRREFRMGLPDEGTISISFQIDATDTDGQVALKAARDARAATNFKILIGPTPDQTLAFTAYVLSYTYSGSIDDVWQGSASLRITGAVTTS